MNKNFTIVASIAVISIIGHLAANWTGSLGKPSNKISYAVSDLGPNLRNEPLVGEITGKVNLTVDYNGKKFKHSFPGNPNVVALKKWLATKTPVKNASNIKLYINKKELKDNRILRSIQPNKRNKIEMQVNIDRKPARAT